MWHHSSYEFSKPITITPAVKRSRSRRGSGTFGTVYEQEGVAIKKIRAPDVAHYLNEIAILRRCHHVNIIEIFSAYMRDANIEITLQLAQRDLKNLTLNPNQRKLFPMQLLEAITYLADRNISHRDIKPQNILLMSPDRICLCDFGCAHDYIDTIDTACATLWYRPPECLLGDIEVSQDYYLRVDVWSWGCCVYEMLTGRALFPGDSEIDEIFCIFRLFGTPTPDDYWSALPEWKTTFPVWKRNSTAIATLCIDTAPMHDQILRSLTLNPKLRPTAREILLGDSAITAESPNKENRRYCYMTRFDSDYLKMRPILFLWLFETVLSFKMDLRALHLAFWIMDVCNISVTMSKEQIQCFGCAALYIASEYCNTYQSPTMDDLIHIMNKKITEQDLTSAISKLLICIEYDTQQTLRYDIVPMHDRILFTLLYIHMPMIDIDQPSTSDTLKTIREYISTHESFRKLVMARYQIDITTI